MKRAICIALLMSSTSCGAVSQLAGGSMDLEKVGKIFKAVSSLTEEMTAEQLNEVATKIRDSYKSLRPDSLIERNAE